MALKNINQQLPMRTALLTLLIFLFSAKFYPQQSTASKNVSTFTIEAPQLETQKKIWIYVPERALKGTKRFPVIYMHDAQNLFDSHTSFAGEWRVDETLDNLHAQVIVVGIEHGNSKRLDELTPHANEKHGGGNANEYLDFITQTLKPYIDKNYKTKPGRQHTAIMGSSLGGLVSHYALLRHPEVFGKAAVFSPSFWFSDEIYETTASASKIKSKIYYLAGNNESEDMVPDLEKMFEIVVQKHAAPSKRLRKVIIDGGQHNEKLWRESFAKAYLWLF